MHIGICGNISLDQLATRLDALMPSDDIVVGMQNAYMQELSMPFGDFLNRDICILALDWQQIVPQLFSCSGNEDRDGVITDVNTAMNELQQTISRFQSITNAKVLVFSPVSGYLPIPGFIDRLLPSGSEQLFSESQSVFNRMCQQLTDVYPVDVDDICNRIGKDNAIEMRNRYEGRGPFSALLIDTVAERLQAICVQLQKYPIKCIVLDLDDTLWGGIVGEVGSEKLLLGEDGPGRAYRDFQAELVRLYKQGVILAVCSKNNTCDALEVMQEHPHMLIRPDMVSSFRINWDDKPLNMVQIASELNISLDALLFVDDNPVERGMMRAALPEVAILELPEDPSYYADSLRRCSRLWPVSITRDDMTKGQFFTQEQFRKRSLEMAANLEDFLMKANIACTIRRADRESLPRVVQLFQKTNQFNLTTIRYSQHDLEKIIKEPDNALFTLQMKDRFGEYGTIAVALVIKNAINSFVLSCRAFGKQVEQAFLVFLLEYFIRNGETVVVGTYRQSSKNSMVKDFYKNAGFELYEDNNEESSWQFNLQQDLPKQPPWITIHRD